MNKRLDNVMVELGFARTRSQAKQLILDGKVIVNGKIATKAGCVIGSQDQVEALEKQTFVGRGAKKLDYVLDYFEIDPIGKISADIGASTGGFTEVLLKRGVSKVYAIDVGHDQLDESLISDDRVINMEGVNIREGVELKEEIYLCVMDLSFISLTLVLDQAVSLLGQQAELVALIKPQFELSSCELGKNGVVKTKESKLNAVKKVYEYCQAHQYPVRNLIKSPIEGKNGNEEYLIHLDFAMNCSADFDLLISRLEIK